MSLPTIKSNFPKSFKMASKKRPQTSQKTENHYFKIKNKNKKFWISTVNILAMFNQLPIRDCFSDPKKTATWMTTNPSPQSNSSLLITSASPIQFAYLKFHSILRQELLKVSGIHFSPVWMKILQLLTLKKRKKARFTTAKHERHLQLQVIRCLVDITQRNFRITQHVLGTMALSQCTFIPQVLESYMDS